jgi:hypothetical protein
LVVCIEAALSRMIFPEIEAVCVPRAPLTLRIANLAVEVAVLPMRRSNVLFTG